MIECMAIHNILVKHFMNIFINRILEHFTVHVIAVLVYCCTIAAVCIAGCGDFSVDESTTWLTLLMMVKAKACVHST